MKILVVNCGSSSIKYQLFDMDEENVLAKGVLEKIGEEGSALSHQTERGEVRIEGLVSDHRAGMRMVIEALVDEAYGAIKDISEISAVGHRVVHGGEEFVESALITEEVVETTRVYGDLAPLHNPPNLMGIEAARSALPHVPQVAVFDTAFHQTLPQETYLYAIPFELYERHKIRKYGFHGTSHRYVSQKAAQILGKSLQDFNAITCHLGNGCSMAAVREGRSVDTSMGFTPLEGLIMGTRSGDIDPALIPFLIERERLDAGQVVDMLNKRSGLLGISGVSNDVRDLQKEARRGNKRAQLALDMFAYRVKKYIGAYAAVLGRLDALIFTGGIGENAVETRSVICRDLDILGIQLDAERNHAPGDGPVIISPEGSSVRVMIVPTDEEALIALDTLEVVKRRVGLRKDRQ